MRVAIISRGESAMTTWPQYLCRQRYDQRICINTAIDLFQAEWLCALDPGTYRFVIGRPLVGLIWSSALLQPGQESTITGREWDGLQVHDHGDHSPHPTFTSESAIYHAVRCLHADDVHLFGFDRGWPGDAHEASTEPGIIAHTSRSLSYHQDRWKLEGKRMRRALDAAAAAGASVTRITTEGEQPYLTNRGQS